MLYALILTAITVVILQYYCTLYENSFTKNSHKDLNI